MYAHRLVNEVGKIYCSLGIGKSRVATMKYSSILEHQKNSLIPNMAQIDKT